MTKNPDNVYSFDVDIVATAYVRAATPEEAFGKLAIAVRDGWGLEVPIIPGADDFDFSGLPYHDPRLPQVSLSPAMTVASIQSTVADHVYAPEPT